jgi:hypothetical protein
MEKKSVTSRNSVKMSGLFGSNSGDYTSCVREQVFAFVYFGGCVREVCAPFNVDRPLISQLLEREQPNNCPSFTGCNQFIAFVLIFAVRGMPTGPFQTNVYVPNTEAVIKFGKDFSIGGWSAVFAKTLCAPIERIKLILQVSCFALHNYDVDFSCKMLRSRLKSHIEA